MEQVREIDEEQAYEKMRRAVVQASQVEKASPQPPNPLERSGGRRSRLTAAWTGTPHPQPVRVGTRVLGPLSPYGPMFSWKGMPAFSQAWMKAI